MTDQWNMPTPQLTTHARKIGDARVTMCMAIFALAWHLISAAQPVLAEHLGPPANAALSLEKLKKLDTFFNDEVSAGKIPGAIVLIEQHDQPVYFKTFGVRDNDTGAPMTPDTIFPIHSMTKTITSFAVMMLIDQGRLRLDDPLAKFIPSFAGARVGVETKDENGAPVLTLVPPRRPINIEDLLLHTSGITYESNGHSLVKKAYTGVTIGDFDNAEFAERIAKLPLAEQPGTLWDYGHSTDILGRVIETVAGTSLLQFEKEALFDPLGMTDTVFYVTDPEKQKLIAKPMPNDADYRVGFDPTVVRKWESGGGGMLTTMADFSRFTQMILDGGKFDGKQYLSPKAFELMTSDHVGPGSGVARDYFYFPGDGFGFGLGFGVRTDPGNAKPPPPGSLGELKWDGASGCYFVIDRKQDMFFVLLEQTPSERQRIQKAVKQLIYEAMEN